MNCGLKQKLFKENGNYRTQELAALADTIKILNDDDTALELFKKTPPQAPTTLFRCRFLRSPPRLVQAFVIMASVVTSFPWLCTAIGRSMTTARRNSVKNNSTFLMPRRSLKMESKLSTRKSQRPPRTFTVSSERGAQDTKQTNMSLCVCWCVTMSSSNHDHVGESHSSTTSTFAVSSANSEFIRAKLRQMKVDLKEKARAGFAQKAPPLQSGRQERATLRQKAIVDAGSLRETTTRREGKNEKSGETRTTSRS